MRDGEMEKNMPLEYSGHLGARQGWSQEYKPLHKPAKKLYEMYQTLTAREREVLHLTVQGLSSAKIGALLSLSSRTVETHRFNLMRKLNVSNRTELMYYAFRVGHLRRVS